jgi:hypothetical protein
MQVLANLESICKTEAVEPATAADALEDAARLASLARQCARWYARYLLLFAIAAFLMSLAFGLVGPKIGALAITPLWVLFVVLISVYAARQRSSLRGTARIHIAMIVAWTVAWLITVVGSFSFHQAFWWWVLGGVATAVPPLVARYFVLRRIAAR